MQHSSITSNQACQEVRCDEREYAIDPTGIQIMEQSDKDFKITTLNVLKEPKDVINKFREGETWKQKQTNK